MHWRTLAGVVFLDCHSWTRCIRDGSADIRRHNWWRPTRVVPQPAGQQPLTRRPEAGDATRPPDTKPRA
jgi:hypothetical protein